MILLLVVGWGIAWFWPLWSALIFGLELVRRRKWASAGYPGDPRWASDWSPEADPAYKFRALSRLRSGQYGEARRFFLKALEAEPGDRLILYNLACAETLGGEAEAALEHLGEALAIDEQLLKRARTDPDLASIRDDPRFPR